MGVREAEGGQGAAAFSFYTPSLDDRGLGAGAGTFRCNEREIIA